MSKGIDYGNGKTNIDHTNGIRYGVISVNDVQQVWCDTSEAFYGDPHCPKCGNKCREVKTRTTCSDPPGQWVSIELDEEFSDDYETSEHECDDYVCESCKYLFGSESAFGEEPLSHYVDDADYAAECTDGYDIFITKSLYYTRAQYCSPCAPGACHLGNPCDDGDKAYCFGHDWFDDGHAPYPVYRVVDDSLILPD